MAKKAGAVVSDRKDPKKNKSLAIRLVLKRLPDVKAAEIVDGVMKEYGHEVNQNMVYMVKTKMNMSAGRKSRGEPKKKVASPMTSAATWVGAIQVARELLKATGGSTNAIALIKALDS